MGAECQRRKDEELATFLQRNSRNVNILKAMIIDKDSSSTHFE